MRIVHLSQSYPPMISGASQFVERLSQGQAARGHLTRVIAASDRGAAYREIVDQVEIVRLRSHPNPFRARQRFMAWPRSALLDAIAEFRPDLLHLHDPFLARPLGLWTRPARPFPVLLTVHALPNMAAAHLPSVLGLHGAIEALTWVYARSLASRCAALVAPSRYVADRVLEQTGYHAHVIPCGIDLNQFKPSVVGVPGASEDRFRLLTQYSLAPDLPIVLHVGRLDQGKRVEIVIRAMARVLCDMPAQLLVVGDGTQRPALAQLAGRLGMGATTHFVGFVSRSGDLPGLYRLSSVFAMASGTETLGIVLLEAAASGLPIVAARATSVPEIVTDKVSGFLVPPGDDRAMAEQLMQCLRHPVAAQSMGLAGRSIAQKYSFENTQNLYELLGSELAVSRGPKAESSNENSN